MKDVNLIGFLLFLALSTIGQNESNNVGPQQLLQIGDYTGVIEFVSEHLAKEDLTHDRVQLYHYLFASYYKLGFKERALEVYKGEISKRGTPIHSYPCERAVLDSYEKFFIDLKLIDSASLIFNQQTECGLISKKSLNWEVGKSFYSQLLSKREVQFSYFDSIDLEQASFNEIEAKLRLSDLLIDYFPKSEPIEDFRDLLIRRKNLIENYFNDNSRVYINEINLLANWYLNDLYDYQTADSLLHIVEAYDSQMVKHNSLEFALKCNTRAGVYLDFGKADSCIIYCEMAMKILEDFNLKNSYLYSSLLNYLAIANKSEGRMSKALLFSKRSYDLVVGFDMIEEGLTRTMNNNLGLTLWRAGDAEMGRKHLELAIEEYEVKGDTVGLNFNSVLINYIRLLNDLGDYKQADKYISRVKQFLIEQGMDRHYLLSILCLAEGENKLYKRDFSGAISSFQQALNIEEANDIPYPGYYANIELSLARVLLRKNDTIGGIQFLEECLRRKLANGEEGSIYLGELYMTLSKYYLGVRNIELANRYYNEARIIVDSLLPQLHYMRIPLEENKILLSGVSNDDNGALAGLSQLYVLLDYRIKSSMRGMNERRVLRFIEHEIKMINNLLLVLLDSEIDEKLMASNLFDIILMIKNLSIRMNRLNLYEGVSGEDENMQFLLAEYKDLRQYISKVSYKAENSKELDSLWSRAEEIETIFNSSFDVNIQEHLTVLDVQGCTDSTSIIFEFYTFTRRDSSQKVIGFCVSHSDIVMQELTNFDDGLETAEKFIHKNINSYTQNIYVSSNGELLGNSPYSLKHDGHYLVDSFQVSIISNYWDLCESVDSTLGASEVVLVGGLSYDENSISRSGNFEVAVRGILSDELPEQVRYLPSSLEEIDEIGRALESSTDELKKFSLSEGYKSKILEYLRKNTPLIVHIGTHGFSLKITSENYSLIPFSSGLILSGYNLVEDKREAIISAYDIEDLNLTQTKLVVLSACNTGLGAVQNLDGLHGLERAFRKAGVSNVVVTIDEIADEIAKEFFTSFYNDLTLGNSIFDSFHKAQQLLKAKYPEEIWTKFLLIGLGREKLFNDGPLDSNKGLMKLVLGLCLIIGLLFFGYRYYRKQRDDI